MYFWLILLHTIASLNNDISISKVNFFYPKKIICALIFIQILLDKILSGFYIKNEALEIIGNILVALYLIYTLCIVFKVLSVIKYLNHSYRYSTWSTIFCLLLTIGFLFFNAHSSYYQKPSLYLSLVLLMNFHIWFISYIYAPNAIIHHKKDNNL